MRANFGEERGPGERPDFRERVVSRLKDRKAYVNVLVYYLSREQQGDEC